MIKNLKRFFLGRLLREKLLLVAFILIGAAIWLSAFSDRAGIFWRQQRAVQKMLADQTYWLGQREAVDAKSRQSIAKLVPARTLSETRLPAELSAMATDVGLKTFAFSDQQSPVTTVLFKQHSLRMTINRASFDTLVKLCLELQKRSPYIVLDEFNMTVDPSSRATGELLTAVLRVYSVEVER
jgi:hypothetical protein